MSIHATVFILVTILAGYAVTATPRDITLDDTCMIRRNSHVRM